ncbi:hypothetical protein V5F77_11270 [Xanthobacter sp. DSM 24535]
MNSPIWPGGAVRVQNLSLEFSQCGIRHFRVFFAMEMLAQRQWRLVAA